jgi:hypothetical protein
MVIRGQEESSMSSQRARAGFGLSILAAAWTVAAPVRADTFWNLKAERTNAPANQAMCMGISGGDPGGYANEGTPIIVWNCNGSNDQTWITWSFDNPPNLFMFEDIAIDGTRPRVGYGLCLSDTGGYKSSTALKVTSCESAYTSQQFTLTNITTDSYGDDCYYITDGNGYIGVANAGVNPVKAGMSVISWPYTGSDDQIWCRHPDPRIVIP